MSSLDPSDSTHDDLEGLVGLDMFGGRRAREGDGLAAHTTEFLCDSSMGRVT